MASVDTKRSSAVFVVVSVGGLWYAARALKDPDDGLSRTAQQARAYMPWLNAVWQFIGSVFFVVAVGLGVDAWKGTKPWGLIVGGVVGSIVGFTAFITTANRLMSQSQRARPVEPQPVEPQPVEPQPPKPDQPS